MESGRTKAIVELVDLFPTACELAGLATPASVQGRSLLPVLLDSKKKIKQSALSFVPKGTGLRTGQWSYMKYKDGTEELYDMNKDPKQFRNLAVQPKFENQLLKQRKILAKRMANLR